jgi:hypothetical protein
METSNKTKALEGSTGINGTEYWRKKLGKVIGG